MWGIGHLWGYRNKQIARKQQAVDQFSRVKKAVWLAMNIAIKSGDAVHTFEIAKKHNVPLSPENMGKLVQAIHASSRSNAEKAAQLMAFLSPSPDQFEGAVNDLIAAQILELDPSKRQQVALQDIGYDLRIKLVKQMLDEKTELAYNIGRVVSLHLAEIKSKEEVELWARLIAYALEKNEVEVACEIAELMVDADPTMVPKETWEELIRKALAASTDLWKTARAIKLANIALPAFGMH